MNIKRTISIVLATVMLMQTIVFANNDTINMLHDEIDSVENFSTEVLGETIDAGNNAAAEIVPTDDSESGSEPAANNTTEGITVDKGNVDIDKPTKYVFEENETEHRFSITVSSTTVIKFNVSYLPRSGDESVLIYYNNLIVNGRKFELKKGTHEFVVKRRNSDILSEFEYSLELLKDYAYDKSQKDTGYNGVDVTTGIYNESFDDLVTVVAGNEFKIQRRYNSNGDEKSLSQGWSINYECEASFAEATYEIIDEDSGYIPFKVPNYNIIGVSIPEGNTFSFKIVEAWNDSLSKKRVIYLPLNSCNRLDFVDDEDSNDNDYYVLTTTDGTKYYYKNIDKSTLEGGQLFKILDLHGNATNIYWDDNHIDYITDIVGNRYVFNYSSIGNRLEQIIFKAKDSDEALLTATYTYNNDNRLSQSVDSSGKVLTYSYIEKNSIDKECLLVSILAGNDILSQISYQEIDGYNCVDEYTDKYGAKQKYTFNRSTNSTTVESTGENGLPRTTIYRYDGDNNIIYQSVEFGDETLETIIQYYTQTYPYIYNAEDNLTVTHAWNNGYIEKITDHNGIITTYSFLETNDDFEKRNYNGLPLSKTVTNSRGHVFEHEEYEYTFGTLIGEKKVYKEEGGDYFATKYSYDTENVFGNGVALLKIEEYPSKYSYENQLPQLTTQYTYDANSAVKGWPISVSYLGVNDSDTDTWTYSYDGKGNLTEVLSPENVESSAKDVCEYNELGLVTKHISAGGTETLYEYNNGLQETKKTVIADPDDRDKDEVTRTIYDEHGRPIQIVSPNEYNPADEGENGLYNNENAGVRNEYYPSDLVKKTIDPEGNTFEYTYDCFGNKISEKLPNGSIYIYTYDELSNLTSKSFKSSDEAEAILLEENVCYFGIEYYYNSGRFSIVNRKYDSDGDAFSTRQIYDHNGRRLRTHVVMVEGIEEEKIHDFRYDLAGNIIYEFHNAKNWQWTEDYYTYNNYDAQNETFYNEKLTLPVTGSTLLDPSYDDLGFGGYRYERTDFDKNGNVVKIQVGRLDSNEVPENVITVETNTYYADNLIESKTDANGVTTLYEYDKDRNLSKITVIENGKEPQIIEYENAHNGKPETIRTHVYDDDGEVSYLTVENSYDKNGNLITQESSTGLTTEYEYNLNNLQTSETSYESGDKEATAVTDLVDYDFMGNVTEQTDKNGNVTKFVYDEKGFLIYTIYPNGGIKLTTRDVQGHAVYEVEPVDYKGTATPDAATLETYKVDLEKIPEMTHTQYTYVPFEKHDLVVTATKYTYDTESKTSTSYIKQTDNYDYFGNLIFTTDANGNTFSYEYDAFGNCIKYIEPETENEYTTFYKYDMLGRKIKEGNSDGNYYEYTYDNAGNLLSSAIVEDGEAQTISTYTYDDGGRILTQTDGNGHTTSLVYDDNNRLMKQYAHGGEDDETKTDYYSYDVLGNLTEHTTRNGDTIEYEYDVFNRLIKTISDDGTVTYTYDGNGNILTMTDSTGTTTYTYDSMGRILTKNHTETGTVSYTYDIYEDIPYGYVAEITTEPDGDVVEKWYDSEDKIVKVIDGTDITWYTYYDDGRLKSTTKPDGSVSTNTYDDEGNLLTLVTLDAAEDVLDSFTYVYDDNSIGYKNQISKTEIVAGENKGTTSYEYDIQGRLTKVTNPDESTNEYTYDDAGNRLSKTTTSGETVVVTNYTYDEQNRLTQSVTGNATTYYGYDNNGNQISEWTRITNVAEPTEGVILGLQNETIDDLLTLYAYDAFDRLVKIEQGADVIENTYTADGKKLSRTTNGEVTYYVYDGNVVIEEQDEDNDETARNVYGRNLVTRETVDGLVVYAYNGHSDVVAICNIDGDILVTYTYDEFGNLIDETVTDETYTNFDNPYRYAGYEYIEEVKLYDLNARYYNPEIARFLSPDPYYNLGNRVIGLYEINVPTAASIMQANNIYVYCGNSPFAFVDKTGHSSVAVVGAALVKYGPAIWAGVKFLAGAFVSAVVGYEIGEEIAESKNNSKKQNTKTENSNSKNDSSKTGNNSETQNDKSNSNKSGTDKDSRLKGNPGDVNEDGYKETKIGDDGRATLERHHTDHDNPKHHTNPHDHKITWENGHPNFSDPINYPNGAPSFK